MATNTRNAPVFTGRSFFDEETGRWHFLVTQDGIQVAAGHRRNEDQARQVMARQLLHVVTTWQHTQTEAAGWQKLIRTKSPVL